MNKLIEKLLVRMTRRIWNAKFHSIILNAKDDLVVDGKQEHAILGKWNRMVWPERNYAEDEPVTPDPMKLNVGRTWGQGEVALGKKNGTEGLYPDTVIWGMHINGICNPTMETLLAEISNSIQRK